MTSLFILAGEASGDLLGSSLIASLKKENPAFAIWGVGGPKMRQEGFECLKQMEEFQVMGIKEILLRPLNIYHQFKTLRNEILKRQPQVVVLIDYPGFNLRLAKSLRKQGYRGKIVQYVSPTVWVWGKGRINTLAENYDLLLTILPFEPQLYAHTPLKTLYVGCPALESIRKYQESPSPLQIHPGKKILGIFPGSRQVEIKNNFRLQLEAAEALTQKYPDYGVAVSCSQPQYRGLIESYIAETNLDGNVTIVEESNTYSLMSACDTALAKSGTVTLELALWKKPTAVVYQVDLFNRFMAKHVLRLNLTHVALANILAGKTIQPEFILEPFTKEQLIAAVETLATDESTRKTHKENCDIITEILGSKRASEEAAKAITTIL